ncbi:CopL family metal-binding regulatory protein [Xanthomonas campestris pv. phormiicola]|nr:CopL family metal-binding regulatory protein [Xanthomonas campestris pv. phormiicola]UYC15823.1 CopL family metal-binding regulatory protein [Xanthomonas campestris pv. phormiicola]
MPIFALLTRLLLCLSLLLNGAGTAVAMPGMHGMDDAAPGTDHDHAMAAGHAGRHLHAAQVASAAMPCHEATPAQVREHEHDGDGHSKGGKHGCCGTAAGCQCPHAQPLPALIALPLALPVAAQRLFPGGRQDGRGAPGLPRLERPPSA